MVNKVDKTHSVIHTVESKEVSAPDAKKDSRVQEIVNKTLVQEPQTAPKIAKKKIVPIALADAKLVVKKEIDDLEANYQSKLNLFQKIATALYLKSMKKKLESSTKPGLISLLGEMRNKLEELKKGRKPADVVNATKSQKVIDDIIVRLKA